MNEKSLWLKANRRLIAKSIGELAYEQVLNPERLEGDGTHFDYVLELSSGISYRFRAWKSLWDHLRVDDRSVKRCWSDGEAAAEDAGQFFIDAQKELALTDIILAQFLEEMSSTLYSDVSLLKTSEHLSCDDLSDWNGLELQGVLNGHPKILLNKGRLGWGIQDLAQYSPEARKNFQMVWLAVASKTLLAGKSEALSWNSIYSQSLSAQELTFFRKQLSLYGLNADDYALLPVHPWQWDRVLRLQYAGAIAQHKVVYLGLAGNDYRPQISLRTLSNAQHPENLDLKLSLSILNTSAVRGISSRYIQNAPSISEAVARLCDRDPVLQAANAVVLKDVAGISLHHPLYEQIEGAPYRYKETFGAIWRESASSKLQDGEKAVLTSSLFHQDENGASLIGAYVRRSGLTIDEWLTRYFDHVVIPLYHLQLRYGVGLVAHGQNIMLRLKDFAPAGMFLKDFQGDLRLSQTADVSDELSALAHLDRMPPDYLIHDLITGHFLTVLRFVSETLFESDSFGEQRFYDLLAERLHAYLENNTIRIRDERLNLRAPRLHRVLLNKVRFKIGYADSAERPLPMVGTHLNNPLFSGVTYE